MSKRLFVNLQLFAQPANHTGADGMSAEMKTYYEKRLLDQAEPLLVHDQFGEKYPIPANNGKSIEFRKYDSLPKALTPLTEGVTPEGQTLTVSTITATVKQYGGWAAITDMLQLTAIDNNIVQATKVLASQAGRTLDSITRDVLAGGTNVIYAPAGSTTVTSRASLTAASVLTPELIDQAATLLKAQNAEQIGESYVAIVHPYVAYDLRRNSEWIDVHKYASPENIYNGEIGKLAGVRFIETSEAKIWKDSSCPSGLAVFSTLVIGSGAYAVTEVEGGGLQHIVKQMGQGEDPLNQRASVGWKAIKTAERLCEQYMVRIESVSPKYSATAQAN
ncbi:MAG: N4-gp56 family major capsid protein [Oscillospiraceae bacterium]